ncbi:hypothetical protein O9929_02155 [Vibrio lentus]|nr:hypothetical protein [Vibrio lentus]
MVQKFGIGYVADEWDSVRKNFGQQKKPKTCRCYWRMLIENDKGNRYDSIPWTCKSCSRFAIVVVE